MNGPNAHPLFSFLKENTDAAELDWNFNKYLLVNGVPVQHYFVNTQPHQIEEDIRKHFASEL